jgi:hypothetical protein
MPKVYRFIMEELWRILPEFVENKYSGARTSVRIFSMRTEVRAPKEETNLQLFTPVSI